ncbi:MAG: hypothetical protein K6U89_17635, partial [Chloroflexi bacterium]|nr:hypothetical protein [Chloroflexota bacterium]
MRPQRLRAILGGLLATAVLALPGILAPWSAAAQAVTVRAQLQGDRFVFNPMTVTVPVGTTVTWVSDAARHTVTSTDGGPLNSPLFGPGESYSYRFTTPGTYNYTCTVHINQTGVVIVTAAPAAPMQPAPPAMQPAPPAMQPAPPAMQPAPPAMQPAPPAMQPAPPAMQPAPPAAAPAPAEVPQFGGANTLAWPPVFSGEIQATVGNATVIVG